MRARNTADTVFSNGMHKNVRRLLSGRHIPPALRQTLPMIGDRDGILAVPFAAARDGTYPGDHTEDTEAVTLLTVRYLTGKDPI